MNIDTLILLLFVASLILTLMALIGYYRPQRVRARNSVEAVKRHGTAALVCYLLMSILLSVHVIDKRGYDRKTLQQQSVLPAYPDTTSTQTH